MKIDILKLNYRFLWLILILLPLIIPENKIYLIIGIFIIFDLLIRVLNKNIKVDILFLKKNTILILFIIYIFFVLLFTVVDLNSIKRFLTFLFHFYFFYITMSYEKVVKKDIFILIFKLLFLVLVVSNILNHNFTLSFSFEKIRSFRYQGLLGMNYHGFISMLLFILCFYVDVFGKKMFMLYSIFNLFISGSRASILCTIVFLISYVVLKNFDKKNLIFSKVIFLISSSFIIFFLSILKKREDLRLMLELNEYSINGRMLPLIKSITAIRNNDYFPYGLGKQIVDKVMNNGPLDTSFLSLFIETGLIGVFLLVVYFLRKLYFFYKFNLSIKRISKNKKKISILISLFIVILFESFFENIVFSSTKLGTFILFLTIVKLDFLMEEK